MSDQSSPSPWAITDQDRRDFLKAMLGLGAASGAAVGTWGALELMVPPGTADVWRKSVCRFCGTGCGVRVGLRGGKVVDVRGDEEAHNKGVICIKGTMLRALPELPGRLLTPKIREGNKFVDATWDQALDLVAKKFQEILKKDGPDALAFYGSGQLFIEESYTANKMFKAGLRTNNVDGNPRLCMASAAVGYVNVFGKDEPAGCYEDIDHADCFFLIGSNAFECHPPIFERIRRRRAVAPRTKLICVDPRRTRTAELSDIHLPVVPGTDMLLLNAMAQVICEQGWADRDFIAEHVNFNDEGKTVSFEEYARFLDAYRPEKVAGELGVSAEAIREVAYHFAKSPATMSLWTMGMNQSAQGSALNESLSGLHLITAQICRPGATPLSLTGQCNACGGVRDTGALATILPGGRLVANPEHRAEMEKLWKVPPGTISPKPGLDAINLFRALEDGRVKGVLSMCTNPGQSLPNADRYRKAMRESFMVVADIFEDTETAKLASVLLPAALWIEKQGVYGQTERRYQLIEKLLDPPGQARSDLNILVDLASRLGLGDLIKARTTEEVWDEWRIISKASKYDFSGITYARLREARGLQWPCPSEDHPGTPRRYVGGVDPFVTPGKKIEFYGHHDNKAVVFLKKYIPSPERTTSEYPFTLTTGRVIEQWHTGTMTYRVPELARGSGPARLDVNPIDALRLGVRAGEEVEIRSRFGTMHATANVSEVPRQGVVFVAFYDSKLLINRVVADHYDPESKEPEYKVTAVAIQKLSNKRSEADHA